MQIETVAPNKLRVLWQAFCPDHPKMLGQGTTEEEAILDLRIQMVEYFDEVKYNE